MYILDHYRPELHYMRGPGPRWLEKHAAQLGANVIPGECGDDQKTPKLIRRIKLSLRRWLPARWRVRRATHEVQCHLSDHLGP